MDILKQFAPLLEATLQETPEAQCLIKSGSYGRAELTPNSDLDYLLLVNTGFEPIVFARYLQTKYPEYINRWIYRPEKKQLYLYIGQQLERIDVLIGYKWAELELFYLGSVLPYPSQAICFDKTQTAAAHFLELTQQPDESKPYLGQSRQHYRQIAEQLIATFETAMEQASKAHVRGDGYKFFVLQSNSLNALVRLVYLAEAPNRWEQQYMPTQFETRFARPLRWPMYELASIDLRYANKIKASLVKHYLEYLPKILEIFGLEHYSVEQSRLFLESILRRDLFRNVRDAGRFVAGFCPKKLFRGSTLNTAPVAEVQAWIRENQIDTVIDLRAPREVDEQPYLEAHISGCRYVHAPFDPWSQSIDFQRTYGHSGSNVEIAYRFFIHECKPAFCAIARAILQTQHAAYIHCHAGKDRTGIAVALLQWLNGASKSDILTDYLASEADLREAYLEIIWAAVETSGGIVEYWKSCGLTAQEVNQLAHIYKMENPCLYPQTNPA